MIHIVMQKAIYPFSADPITYGHMNIIERAATSFDLIVGIGSNPAKRYLFSLEERIEMTAKALPRIAVKSYDGMLTDFLRDNHAKIMVRGIRGPEDLEYEKTLDAVYKSQASVETYLLFAEPHLTHISSTAAKALQQAAGDIISYVPIHVKQKLEEKISGSYRLGLVTRDMPEQHLRMLSEKGISATRAKGYTRGFADLCNNNIVMDDPPQELLDKINCERHGHVWSPSKDPTEILEYFGLKDD